MKFGIFYRFKENIANCDLVIEAQGRCWKFRCSIWILWRYAYHVRDFTKLIHKNFCQRPCTTPMFKSLFTGMLIP